MGLSGHGKTVKKTSPTDRVRVGFVPVEIRFVVPPGHDIHKITIWCEHREEAKQLLDAMHLHPFPGFRGTTFSLPPGLLVVFAERTDWLAG